MADGWGDVRLVYVGLNDGGGGAERKNSLSLLQPLAGQLLSLATCSLGAANCLT